MTINRLAKDSIVNDDDFEGTLILEKLSEIGKIEEFYDAIDSDDFKKALFLMKLAKIDDQSISVVLKKMNSGS